MAEQQERQREEEKLVIPVRDQQQLLRTSQRSAILLIVALSSLVGIALFLTASSFSSAILHQVPHDHVGVYWRGGVLMRALTPPGFHLKLPSTEFRPIEVVIRLDAVEDVPCTTKDGVNITFEKIEVVSRLPREHVYEVLLEHGADYHKTLMLDRIHPKVKEICSEHDVKEFYPGRFDFVGEEMEFDFKAHCSRYAPGLLMQGVLVYDPIVPESIERFYSRLEEKRVKALIAAEMQKTE